MYTEFQTQIGSLSVAVYRAKKKANVDVCCVFSQDDSQVTSSFYYKKRAPSSFSVSAEFCPSFEFNTKILIIDVYKIYIHQVKMVQKYDVVFAFTTIFFYVYFKGHTASFEVFVYFYINKNASIFVRNKCFLYTIIISN